MLEQYCRAGYQRWCVDPLAHYLQRYVFFSPLKITVLGLLLGIFAAGLLFVGDPLGASVLLILSGYCDSLDGTVARLIGASSARGSVLDIVADRAVEFAILLGLLSVDPVGRAWWVAWMLGSTLLCVTSFLVVGIFTQNRGQKGFYYSVGIMERAEAFVFFILMMLVPSEFALLAGFYTGLVVLTSVIRVVQFWRQESVHESSKLSS